MPNGTSWRQHPNAPLTPEGRRRMVWCVTDRKWTVEATAERFQVDAKTVRKLRDRWLAEGDLGLQDRSSRLYRSPNRTGRQLRRKVCRIRPQTNSKVELFHRILLEERAYIRPWRSETQRADAYVGFIHFYNHHRSHGSLKWATPISIIQDNLPEEHT